MSKILKFIVNICLVALILTAVAILVPPLIGITTTIVDTPTMNTNLPLGSVTYSTDVDASEIEVGDEILKETGNTSTYAYIVRAADPDTGKFTVVSAMDPDGSEQEIYLRNNVPKVAVIVPVIGYSLIAMHTLEGRIIVGLLVALLIILFILSELWRPVDDEEEEIDEDLPEEEAQERENGGVTAREETDIDTEAIRAAVEENQTAVELENAAAEAAEAEESGEAEEASAEEVLSGESESAEEAPDDGENIYGEYAQDENGAPYEDADSADYESSDLEEQYVPTEMREIRVEMEEDTGFGESEETAAGKAFEGEEISSGSEETGADEESAPDEIPDGTSEEDEVSEEAVSAAARSADEALLSSELAEEAAEEQATESEDAPTDEEVFPGDDTVLSDITDEADYIISGRFVPVPHPDLDEILEGARAAGDNPKLVKDDSTGITFVDYSSIL